MLRRRFAFTASAAPALSLVAALLGVGAVVAVQACGSSGGNAGGDLADGGDASAADVGDLGVGDDVGFVLDGSPTCAPGEACGTAGLCSSAGACCEPAIKACGSTCCAGGTICYGGRCVTPGNACKTADDCAAGENCDPTLGTDLDAGVSACGDAVAASPLGRCVPRPITCPVGSDAGVDDAGQPCVAVCEWRPPPGSFDPVVEWEWPKGQTGVAAPTYNQVMSAPVVGPLVDTNCDGKFDDKDTPVVVFNTYTDAVYDKDGILRAVSGKNGKSVWDATDAALRTVPGASIAIGEIEPSSPGPEIATCANDHTLMVLSAAGKLLWKTTDPKIVCDYGGPQLGDVDGDGRPELLVRYTVVDAKTHAIRFQGRVSAFPYPTADYSTFADVDGDGDLDVVGGNVVYANDGTGKFTTLWDGATFAPAIPDGYVAIADLDLAADGLPELVTVSSLEQSLHDIRVINPRNGSIVWGPIDTNLGSAVESGGGPPTIADFDGDGKPEIAMAGGYSYNVFNGQTGKLKWKDATVDHSSRVTGSSVFDFDGTGAAKVLYGDEQNLHVYDGVTGKELLTMCNPSGTLWEYPLVVDVDGDDQAEILVVANDMWWGCNGAAVGPTSSPVARASGSNWGTGPTGLRSIGSKAGNWVRTRRIWNQHTYHVTNVNDDATIPAHELPNWKQKGLNNFRQNVQSKGLFDAPNAVAEVEATCTADPTLTARVHNVGTATLPAGVAVGFYSVDAAGVKTKIGSATTADAVLPGGSTSVSMTWTSPPPEFLGGATGIVVVVDDGAPAHSWHECRADDNVSPLYRRKCVS
jgi:hypothetical protein